MLDTAPVLLAAASGSSIRTARVLTAMDGAGQLRIRMDGSDGSFDEPEVRAGVALTGARAPAPGDRALVAVSDTGETFVIGIIAGQAPQQQPPPAEFRLADGATVRTSGEASPRTLTVLSANRRPLIEYDASTGRVTLNAPTGDLEFSSPEGDIVLNAAGTVRLRGGAVEATGHSRVELGIENGSRRAVSRISLDAAATRIAGPVLAVAAQRAKLNLNDAAYTGERISARIGSLSTVIRRLERTADEVHERAGRLYTAVRDVVELRAGRVRTLVESTYRLKAKRAHLKSDEDFKVSGDQIHLG